MRSKKQILDMLRRVESQRESLMTQEVKTSRLAVIYTLRWVLDMLDESYMKKFEEEHGKRHLKPFEDISGSR